MKKLALTIAALTVVAFLAAFFFLLLPYAANTYLIPSVTNNLPFDKKRLHIASLTPQQISGSLDLGNKSGKGVSVPLFEINYSARGIVSGELASLVINSPRITLQRGESGITVSGLQSGGATGQKQEDPTLPVLPLRIDTVVIKDGLLLYTGDVHLPGILFDMELHLDYDADANGKYRLTGVEGKLSSSGMVTLESDFTIEQHGEGLAGRLDGMVDRLETAARPLLASFGIELAGNMHFQADIETEALRRLKHFNGTLRFDDFKLVRDTVVLKGSDTARTLALEVNGDDKHIEYQLAGLALHAPENVGISGAGRYVFKSRQSKGWVTAIPARTGSEIELTYQGTVGSATDISYSVEGDGATMDGWLEVEPFTGHGTLKYDDSSLAATFSASFPTIRDTLRGLTVTGLSVDLPFNAPEKIPGGVVPGNISAKEIAYGDTVIARLAGALSLSRRVVQYSAESTSPLNEKLKVTCSGESVFAGDSSLDCYLPDVAIAASQFRGVAPLPQKLDFQGEVSAETHLHLRNGSPSGTAKISLRNTGVDFDKYSASGIAGELIFPDLPAIRSAGGQEIRIEKIDLGNIKMSDAIVRLRVDDAESLFIERAKLGWCGGRVETAGLMITKGMKQLDATLYCDRLAYTELLGQLGIGNAQGEGSLNGRLPMRISRNDIEFDDGFLFSTPGQSGIVRFSDTDQFRQGMGEAGNSVYLEYTLKALENFSYNWTKLMFNTEKDDLLLTLQLDGKPADPLPYGYRDGRIVKNEQGSGLQHPIRLDVNFRLPLQELFRYGKNIQSIMENM